MRSWEDSFLLQTQFSWRCDHKEANLSHSFTVERHPFYYDYMLSEVITVYSVCGTHSLYTCSMYTQIKLINRFFRYEALYLSCIFVRWFANTKCKKYMFYSVWEWELDTYKNIVDTICNSHSCLALENLYWYCNGGLEWDQAGEVQRRRFWWDSVLDQWDYICL